MSKISILHISDIHKKDSDNYSNLLSSLETDIDYCYTHKNINKPSVIVVSGDIIKGAKGENAEKEIRAQYQEVYEFLETIVSVFLNGDRRKIIIVPGNHDINHSASQKSMTKIFPPDKEDAHILVRKMIEGDSIIRWSWSDLHFYEVTDLGMYNARLDLFIEFFNRFYNGIYSFSSVDKEQSCVFEMQEHNIAFVGFNSCCDLDHLNTSGKIHPNSLTRLDTTLRNLHNQGFLLIGVWHHHTNGAPYENNYLDKRILSSMIDKHIYLGLHGHQHIASIANEFKDSINGDSLFLISAGTLYGGREEIPYRTGRQYNLIEIECGTEVTVKVHSREDNAKALFAIPSWSDGRIGNISHLEFRLPKPPQPDITITIDRILRDTQDIAMICDELSELDTENLLVRKFLLDFLQKMNAYERIYTVFIHPKNINEAVALLEAVNELNDEAKAREVLLDVFINNSKDASVQFLRDHVRRIIKNK